MDKIVFNVYVRSDIARDISDVDMVVYEWDDWFDIDLMGRRTENYK